jgi:Histidine kinase
MTSQQAAAAINVLGFSAGSLLYAMLLAMVARESRPLPRVPGVEPALGARDLVLLGTAVAGLVWNVGALLTYGLLDVGRMPPALVRVAAFSALGFLPAGVVHAVLRHGQATRVKDIVAVLGYGLASAAALLQVGAGFHGDPLPHALAFRLLTFGFVLLMPLVFMLTRPQPGARSAGWILALGVFAVSALHLAEHHLHESWLLELVGHHAALPLVLALLYQDYPFALADLFLKRALAVLGLGALVLVAWVAVVLAPDSRLGTPGVLLGAWILTALLFPLVQRGAAHLVDTVLLHRFDYDELRARIGRALGQSDDEAAMLAAACDLLGPALNAQRVAWRLAQSTGVDLAPLGLVDVGPRRTDATVFIPGAEPPWYVIDIDEIAGGRRLLSDDVAMLEQVAFAVARRIDVVRLTRERFASRLREEEAQRRAVEARLEALRAQIHPHFLFNALNTVGHLIHAAPSRALGTLLKLTEVLRQVLRADTRLTRLREELALVNAYLEIEQARFEERLRVGIDVPDALLEALVPPLVLQPLVENAVKHGISPLASGGVVTVRARETEPLGDERRLELVVADTGRGPRTEATPRHGIGLANLERRLSLAFGSRASVALVREDGHTVARVVLPLTRLAEPATISGSARARA